MHLPAASACALHRSHAYTLFELHSSGPGAYGLNFAARPVQAAAMAEGGDTNFRELLQRIETALCDAAEVDAASFLQTLQRAKPSFLNLFRYKARAWDASRGRLSPFGAVGQQCCLFEAASRPTASPMSSVPVLIAIGNEPPPLGGMWAPPPAAACCRSLLPPWALTAMPSC